MNRPEWSPYMHWVKTQANAKYNLVISGLRNYPLHLLNADFGGMQLSGPGAYGYRPLVEAIAEKCGVSPDRIATAQGTSMANFLVMSALLNAGDEVLIEKPGYPLLWETAQFLGADVKFFRRTPEIDLDHLKAQVSARTRLIVLTNLHNPSCAALSEDDLLRMAELSSAHILVDEVYLDLLFEQAPETAAKLGPRFISTNSLTKAYGLSGLRCGWIVAEPELIRRIYLINDFMGVNNPYVTDQLSAVALAQRAEILQSTRELLDTNRRIAHELGFTLPDAGTVMFQNLHTPAEPFCEFLRIKYDTQIVPGHFFGAPDHVRIGFAGDTNTLREGLTRVRDALAAYLRP